MNEQLLNDFFQGLKTGQVSNPGLFSTAVKADIFAAYSDVQQHGASYDIEINHIVESEKNIKLKKKIRFSGNFIYGFQKNGIFHANPGEVGTKIPRQPTETGFFEFTLDGQGTVISIYNSLDGNYFGSREKNSILQKIKSFLNISAWLIIALFIIALVAFMFSALLYDFR